MINERELRIGNIASLRGHIAPVDLYSFYCAYEESFDAFNQYDPILITEEILLKCGFELDYKSKYSKKYTHQKAEIGYDYNLVEGWSRARYYDRYIKCDYLHQLQNLFFLLLGEELEINLIEIATA